MFKLYRVEVSLPQWEYRSSKASNESFLSEEAPQTVVQVALTQCVELSIDELVSKTFTNNEFIKEDAPKKMDEAACIDDDPQVEL